MSTLKYRTVMALNNPIPSQRIYELSSHSREPVIPPKPFQVLMNETEVLTVPGYSKQIFIGFRFIFQHSVLLLKTVDNKFVVLHYCGAERTYKLFSIKNRYVFDEVVDINCGVEQSLAKVLMFSFITYNTEYSYAKKFEKYQKEMFFCNVGWNHMPGKLHGLDPIPLTILRPKACLNTPEPIVRELFGPLPQHPGKFDYRYNHNPWWVALCSDNLYRILLPGLEWLTTADETDVEVFKRFIPTAQPNYFYFLTTKNEELLLRGENIYRSIEEAREGKPIEQLCLYHETEGEILFPGQRYKIWKAKDHDEIIPGVLDNQQDPETW